MILNSVGHETLRILKLKRNMVLGFAYRCGVEKLANGLKSGEIRGPHIQLAKSFADQLTYRSSDK